MKTNLFLSKASIIMSVLFVFWLILISLDIGFINRISGNMNFIIYFLYAFVSFSFVASLVYFVKLRTKKSLYALMFSSIGIGTVVFGVVVVLYLFAESMSNFG